jgi:hypothetical protein
MMKVFGIALLLMVVVTTANHLGLPQAIAEVVSKICGCHKCLSFWSTLIVLTWITGDIIAAAMLSIVSAYASNWFALVLIFLNKQYNKIWEKVKKK